MTRPTASVSPSAASPKVILLAVGAFAFVGAVPAGALADAEASQRASCDIEKVTPAGALRGITKVTFRPLSSSSADENTPEFKIALVDSQGRTTKSYLGRGSLRGKSAQVTTYDFDRSSNSSDYVRGDKNGRFFLEYGRSGWFTIREEGERRLDIEFAGCTWSRRS